MGWQAQRHHSTVPAPAPHPLPAAVSAISAPVPGSERVAIAADRCRLEGQQRRLIGGVGGQERGEEHGGGY